MGCVEQDVVLMRWPLMFRATHDALMAAKDAELALQTAIADRAHAGWAAATNRHDAFVLEVAALTKPTQVPVATPRPKREPDQADTAIDFVARDNYPMKRELERYAKTERAKGTEPEKIAAEILAMVRPKESDDEFPG